VVDTPLSSGAPAAAKDSLMLGGRAADTARSKPLLSTNFTRLGACGAGQPVKH
jgi:3-hydroxyisobutyrate dehydrogenase-like beta-hydroxyacid dehydrogenase